jgi:hypothetical protein
MEGQGMSELNIRKIIQQVQNETIYEGRYTEEDRLVAAVEGLVEAARIKTLEEVCEVLCIHCENGDSTVTKDERGEYVHFWFGKEYVLECKAGMIRRLMAR